MHVEDDGFSFIARYFLYDKKKLEKTIVKRTSKNRIFWSQILCCFALSLLLSFSWNGFQMKIFLFFFFSYFAFSFCTSLNRFLRFVGDSVWKTQTIALSLKIYLWNDSTGKFQCYFPYFRRYFSFVLLLRFLSTLRVYNLPHARPNIYRNVKRRKNQTKIARTKVKKQNFRCDNKTFFSFFSLIPTLNVG